jgi:hypothetical protein
VQTDEAIICKPCAYLNSLGKGCATGFRRKTHRETTLGQNRIPALEKKETFIGLVGAWSEW